MLKFYTPDRKGKIEPYSYRSRARLVGKCIENIGQAFNNMGTKTLASVGRAAKSGKKEDWQAVHHNYMIYWVGLGGGFKKEYEQYLIKTTGKPKLEIQPNETPEDFNNRVNDSVIIFKLDTGKIGPGNVIHQDYGKLTLGKYPSGSHPSVTKLVKYLESGNCEVVQSDQILKESC